MTSGAPGAFAEVQGDVGVGQRRQAFEGGDQLPVCGVGLDPAGLLDQGAAFGCAGDEVEGYEGAVGVLVGGRQVERAFDRFFQERGVGDDRAELGCFGAAFPRPGLELLVAVLLFGAGGEAFGGGGVGGDPFGQGDFELLGLGFGGAAGAEQALARQAQLEVEARAARRQARGRLGVDPGREGDRLAAAQGERVAAGVQGGRGLGVEDAGVLSWSRRRVRAPAGKSRRSAG